MTKFLPDLDRLIDSQQIMILQLECEDEFEFIIDKSDVKNLELGNLLSNQLNAEDMILK